MRMYAGKDAVISACGKYQYLLWRVLVVSLQPRTHGVGCTRTQAENVLRNYQERRAKASPIRRRLDAAAPVGQAVRALKVHALKGNGQTLFAGQSYCEDTRAREFTMRPWHEEGRDITCLRCLYYAGLYVPLVKLKEHQAEQRAAMRRADALVNDYIRVRRAQ